MSKTVSDEWTELLADGHGETFFTVEISGEDVWLYKTGGAPPDELVKGVTGRSNESIIMEIPQSRALFARCQAAGQTANVRIVAGHRADSTGRATVKADLVGTPSVDVSDRQGRNLGKLRLMDSAGVLVDAGNPLDVARPNDSDVHTDSISPSATGDSFAAQAVPPGAQVVYRVDPSDGDDVVDLEGFPLDAGESVELAVDDVSVPTFNGDGAATVHAIVEVA